jgi:hypothetical protein
MKNSAMSAIKMKRYSGIGLSWKASNQWAAAPFSLFF